DSAALRCPCVAHGAVLGNPLEYFATSPGGWKAYESLLELDATGSEFNLACILVGLERSPKQMEFQRYSQKALTRQRAALSIAWSEGATRRRLSAADALTNPQTGVRAASIDWVYVGSPVSK